MDWLGWWTDTRSYMPHGHCYLWQPSVLWMHVGADAAIGASYVAIPAVIGSYLRQRWIEIELRWVPLLFAAFITLCGLTHFFEIWTVWHPSYKLSGLLKVLTAVVSTGTAASLMFIMPRAMQLHTPRQLEALVAQRTRELADANARLMREIEARRESERALQQRDDEMRQLDVRKDEFLATLAHELRNPLAPLQNGLSLLEHATDASRRESLVAMMSRQLAHLVRLVDDLLDVARITTRQMELRVEPAVLQDVVRQAVEATVHAFEARRHRLDVEMPPEPVPIEADAVRLTQVMINLLNNSAKYMDDGGEVRLRARVAEQVELSVSDRGHGISADRLPGVFDLFNRSRPPQHRRVDAASGLGVGLSLSRRIVELHGGTIHAHSDGPGQGSTFTVRIPSRRSG